MDEVLVDAETQREVERLLYREARLLDEGKFEEWLELFTDDVRYVVPIRETLQRTLEPDGADDGLTVSFMDDDKTFLGLRVARLRTGIAHAETPPSRTRHLITNVEVEPTADGELLVYSSFVVFQGRREHSDTAFYGAREDLLRRVEGDWKIARRTVTLDHAVLPRGLSILF